MKKQLVASAITMGLVANMAIWALPTSAFSAVDENFKDYQLIIDKIVPSGNYINVRNNNNDEINYQSVIFSAFTADYEVDMSRVGTMAPAGTDEIVTISFPMVGGAALLPGKTKQIGSSNGSKLKENVNGILYYTAFFSGSMKPREVYKISYQSCLDEVEGNLNGLECRAAIEDGRLTYEAYVNGVKVSDVEDDSQDENENENQDDGDDIGDTGDVSGEGEDDNEDEAAGDDEVTEDNSDGVGDVSESEGNNEENEEGGVLGDAEEDRGGEVENEDVIDEGLADLAGVGSGSGLGEAGSKVDYASKEELGWKNVSYTDGQTYKLGDNFVVENTETDDFVVDSNEVVAATRESGESNSNDENWLWRWGRLVAGGLVLGLVTILGSFGLYKFWVFLVKSKRDDDGNRVSLIKKCKKPML